MKSKNTAIICITIISLLLFWTLVIPFMGILIIYDLVAYDK